MKVLLFAAAFVAGSAAVAQAPVATAPAPAAPAGQVVAPSNADPERDARGIAVISDPAVAPAGWNQPPGVGGPDDPAASERPAPQPATEDYPSCSRTVTDNCVQAYERGRAPRG